MIKRKAQRIHAKRRFLERTGLSLTTAQLEAMAIEIRAGKALFVRKQSLRVSHWIVKHEDRDLRVVYDRRTGQVVTVLNEKEAENGG